MPQYYDDEFKKKIVRLKLEEGRTAKSIISEYGVSKASITKWCQEFREECQSNPEAQKNFDSMKEILRLKKELEEVKKENLFLKKAAAFFAKEIDWRLIGLFKNITTYLVSDGFYVISISVPMLIITT